MAAANVNKCKQVSGSGVTDAPMVDPVPPGRASRRAGAGGRPRGVCRPPGASPPAGTKAAAGSSGQPPGACRHGTPRPASRPAPARLTRGTCLPGLPLACLCFCFSYRVVPQRRARASQAEEGEQGGGHPPRRAGYRGRLGQVPRPGPGPAVWGVGQHRGGCTPPIRLAAPVVANVWKYGIVMAVIVVGCVS